MPNFISDDEMEKLSPSNSKPGFISDEEMENHELSQTINPMVSGIRKGVQGASAGFLDEASGGMEAIGKLAGLKGLGGSFDDVGVDKTGSAVKMGYYPEIDFDALKKAYYEGRDRKRKYLAQDQIDNPEVSTIAELGGAIASPVNKILPNASMVKSGAVIGGITGFGNSDADDLAGMTKDTAMGFGGGAILGKAADKAAPYIGKAGTAFNERLAPFKQATGKKLSEMAEELAFKSTGARLKDFRVANDRGELNKIGRYLLDKGIVKSFDSVDDIGRKSLENKKAAGSALDEIYSQAEALFKDKIGKVGFDPLRDKAEIMMAAKRELGDTVGSEAALNKLSKYLDDVAANHGDAPMQSAMREYQSQMDDYIPKQERFLKNQSDYNFQLGNAGDDLSQPVLPGIYDDFQRTGTGPRQIELMGDDAAKMTPESFEFSNQMELPQMPSGNSEAQRLFSKPGDANFGDLGGDAANRLPMKTKERLQELAQKDFLEKRYNNSILDSSEQGLINGTELTPRSFQNVDDTVINSGKGQMQFPIAPEAPIAPNLPADIRNPMSPRRANDIKGALDNEINYSRNPLSKDPASEKAFYGARKSLAQKVEQGLDDLGGGEIVDKLRQANKDYGISTKVNQMAEDRASREAANKMFGLTDTIAAGAATTYGVATGDWKGSFAAIAAKKGFEKYGVSTLAVMADKVGKQLMRSPQLAQMAAKNPKAFGAMVYSLVDRLEQRGPMAIPKAADSEQGDVSGNDRMFNYLQQNPGRFDSIKSERLKEQLKNKLQERNVKDKVPLKQAQADFVNNN